MRKTASGTILPVPDDNSGPLDHLGEEFPGLGSAVQAHPAILQQNVSLRTYTTANPIKCQT
jgi:hypothetical protein